MRSGITRRWLRGNLLITVLLVLLAETMFLYNYTRSYYNSVQQTMYRRFSSVSGQLKMYTGDTVQSTAATRSVALRRMVEQFALPVDIVAAGRRNNPPEEGVPPLCVYNPLHYMELDRKSVV